MLKRKNELFCFQQTGTDFLLILSCSITLTLSTTMGNNDQDYGEENQKFLKPRDSACFLKLLK